LGLRHDVGAAQQQSVGRRTRAISALEASILMVSVKWLAAVAGRTISSSSRAIARISSKAEEVGALGVGAGGDSSAHLDTAFARHGIKAQWHYLKKK
jgi:hypothetical protein